jgi:hypothetical protein
MAWKVGCPLFFIVSERAECAQRELQERLLAANDYTMADVDRG